MVDGLVPLEKLTTVKNWCSVMKKIPHLHRQKKRDLKVLVMDMKRKATEKETTVTVEGIILTKLVTETDCQAVTGIAVLTENADCLIENTGNMRETDLRVEIDPSLNAREVMEVIGVECLEKLGVQDQDHMAPDHMADPIRWIDIGKQEFHLITEDHHHTWIIAVRLLETTGDWHKITVVPQPLNSAAHLHLLIIVDLQLQEAMALVQGVMYCQHLLETTGDRLLLNPELLHHLAFQ
jgi:hypothetical protein